MFAKSRMSMKRSSTPKTRATIPGVGKKPSLDRIARSMTRPVTDNKRQKVAWTGSNAVPGIMRVDVNIVIHESRSAPKEMIIVNSIRVVS